MYTNVSNMYNRNIEVSDGSSYCVRCLVAAKSLHIERGDNKPERDLIAHLLIYLDTLFRD